jgi:dephospho-CoA kinase
MPVLGITGGIGTGKSFVASLLSGLLNAVSVDLDTVGHRVLSTRQGVRDRLEFEFGPGVLGGDPEQERRRIRELVFREPEKRRVLESVLHPEIRREWEGLAADFREKPGWLCLEVPLLYEVAVEAQFTRIVVAACSPEVQRSRLLEKRGLSAETADKIRASQLELGIKIQRGDHVIWNDSTKTAVETQCALLAGWLKAVYG